jgi:hypothetical protein
VTDRLDVARAWRWERGRRAALRARHVRLREALAEVLAADAEPDLLGCRQMEEWRIQQFRDRLQRSVRAMEGEPQ